MQWADNAGATDEHRALNYLALRYSAIYHKVMEQFQKGFGLKEVEIQRSRLSGTRNIVDVIFAFNDRRTDFIEKFFVRVDVTEEFPFLVTKLSPITIAETEMIGDIEMNMPGFTADACLNDKIESSRAQNYRMDNIFAGSTAARVLLQGCRPDRYRLGCYCCQCWGQDYGCGWPYPIC